LDRPLSPPVRTILSEPYVVWESGNSGNFTIELELRYPPQTITYPPSLQFSSSELARTMCEP